MRAIADNLRPADHVLLEKYTRDLIQSRTVVISRVTRVYVCEKFRGILKDNELKTIDILYDRFNAESTLIVKLIRHRIVRNHEKARYISSIKNTRS